MVVCIALGVDVFRGGSCPPLYIRGDRVTWKVLAEYIWSPTTTQSSSFLCTAASSMPIRVVTKDVRYIHVLSLTLEHSMSISSTAVPGLTMCVDYTSLNKACPKDPFPLPRIDQIIDSTSGCEILSFLDA